MIFDIQYKEQKVVDGYSIAGEVFLSPDLVERIEDCVRFTYTPSDSSQVAREFRCFQKEVEATLRRKIKVVDYYYKNPRVIGMTRGGWTIYVNRNGLNKRSVVDYLRNGSHEVAHLLDFGHGSNWMQDTWKGRMMCRLAGDREDKELSVPYMMEKIVLQLAIEKGLLHGN